MALNWTLHHDGKTIRDGEIVRPGERLTWPRTIGLGAQHVVAMFGATFLVPTITGFPVTATLFFSGMGTLLFLLLTQNRLPSYLGSSFAFLAPIAAVSAGEGRSRSRCSVSWSPASCWRWWARSSCAPASAGSTPSCRRWWPARSSP